LRDDCNRRVEDLKKYYGLTVWICVPFNAFCKIIKTIYIKIYISNIPEATIDTIHTKIPNNKIYKSYNIVNKVLHNIKTQKKPHVSGNLLQ